MDSGVDVAAGAPIDAQHGVNPNEPKTTLEVPPVDVIDRILSLWKANKKTADVVLALDTSGSMNEERKMENARLGAHQFVSVMGDADTLSLLPFSTECNWAFQDVILGQPGKTKANTVVDSLFAGGDTSLYDAIRMGYEHLKARGSEGKKIQAVVVLTDGADTNSKTRLNDLIHEVQFNGENSTIRVFTIAYGSDAKKDVLQQIADATQAKSYEGTPNTIVGVFRDVSTFF